MSQHLIEKLYQYGHFHNPLFHNDIRSMDLSKLSLKQKNVKLAILSYQQFFCDELNERCQTYHGRNLRPDGEIGPATEWLLNQPRCCCPDYGNTVTDNVLLSAMEANWPDACKFDISVSYLLRRLNISQDTIHQAWSLALKSWEDVIKIKFHLLQDFTRNSRIWATDGPLPGSTLAWSQLAYNNCAANLEQRYDTLVNWNLKFFKSTIIHEVGHALGSGHLNTRSAIMYPMITSIDEPQTPDINNMVRLGYKKNNDPTPPSPPVPPNPPNPPNPLTPSPSPNVPTNIWQKILKQIIEILNNCQKTNGKHETRKRLLNKTFREKVLVAQSVRQALTPEEYGQFGRQATIDMLHSYDESSDDELVQLLNSTNYLLI